MNKENSDFIEYIKSSFANGDFLKLILSKASKKDQEIKKVTARIISLKWEKVLSFVFAHATKDITKNLNIEDSISQVIKTLGADFKNAVLFTTKNDIRLSYNSKMKPSLFVGKPTMSKVVTTSHNREKHRYIEINNNNYLKELWVVTHNNGLAHNMHSKFKQINKYIETIDNILSSSPISKKELLTIADMGSGKGYLTFALHDFLTNTKKKDVSITWVEMRKELIDLCNSIVEKYNYQWLNFLQGDIQSFGSKKIDILIALHACDTATDDAIHQGITWNASIIITAPCCHKQIRKELNVTNQLKDIIKHWILKERQSEILTDTMRWLMLEAHWYKTQIFEFIADAHTHKNVMIVWVKNPQGTDNSRKEEYNNKIQWLKKIFGVETFYLEELFTK